MTNIIFHDTFTHKVDNKGRVSIPSQWRKFLSTTLYYYLPSENSTKMFCYATIESIMRRNLALSEADMYSRIKKCTIDKQGRICTSKMNCEALLLGRGHYFEIQFVDNLDK